MFGLPHMTFCFQSKLKLLHVGEVCEGPARKQLRTKGMEGDGEVEPGQKSRQKCDQEDDVLLCLVDSGRDQSALTRL